MPDHEAKSAAQLSRAELWAVPAATRPMLVAKSFIKRRLGDCWQGWWNSTDRGRNLYRFKDSVLVPTPPELYVGLPRRNQVCLTRLRLGNETTNDVLFKVGKAASPECDGCSVVLDSSYHRMYECASLASQRLALKQRLRLIQSSLDFNNDVVLGLQGVYSCNKQKVVHAFCDFLESTGLNKLFLWRPTVSNEEDLT